MQTALPVSANYGQLGAVEVASYTVRAVAVDQATLDFLSDSAKGYIPAPSEASLWRAWASSTTGFMACNRRTISGPW